MQNTNNEQSTTLEHPRKLNRRDVTTLSLASFGGALEFYDFIIFALFTKYMGDAFFPAHLDPFWKGMGTYGAFAAAYIMRPVGGIVMAHFGDLIGRKRMFAVSILMMALPTFLIGLLPTFSQIGYFAPILLLIMRMVQGIAIGGELPSAWVFVSEHVPFRRMGMGNGFLTCGVSSGILLGALMALLMQAVFPENNTGGSFTLGSRQDLHDWGWRIPFVVGGLLGFVTMYLRRWLHETPVFKEMQEKKTLSKGIPLIEAVRNYTKGVFISMLMTWLLTCGILVGLILMPGLMMGAPYNIPGTVVFSMNCLAVLVASLGCIFWGTLCDKLGAGMTTILGCISLAISSYFLYANLANPDYVIIRNLYILMGFCIGTVGVVPYVMIKMFPPKVRLSGVSFSYNLSYAIFGSTTPLLFVWIISKDPFGMAYYFLALCTITALCGIYLAVKKI